MPDNDDETRYALSLARQRVYNPMGDRRAQTRDLESLAALADRAHDAHKVAEVLIRRAEQAVSVHDAEVALSLARRAIELARASNDLTLEGSAYFRIGQALADPGAADTQVLDYLERALTIVRTSGPQRLEAEILITMGVDLSRELRPEGRDLLRQALELYRAAADRSGEGRALRQLAGVSGFFGDFASGRAGGLAALPILREVGDQQAQGSTLYVLGFHETCLGRYSEALTHLAAAQPLCQSVGDRVTEAGCFACRGIIFDELGDYSRAWREIQAALAFPTQRRGLIPRAWGLGRAALILVHQGLLQDAQTYAQRAIDFVLETGHYAEYGWLPYNRAVAHMVMGHALADLGDDRGARQAYDTALGVVQKAGPPGVPAEVQAALARLYMHQGRLSAALAQVEQILAYLEHGGVDGTAEPVRIYLTCYQVLEAAGDPRAWGTLAEGYRLLSGRAAAVDDELLRRSYLENVAADP